MQVSVETKEGLAREMIVEIPSSKVNDEISNRLKSLTKTAKINGFRPGKIPFSVINKRYGQQVHAEVLNETLQQSYYEAISQEKIRPAGYPSIDMVDTEEKDKIAFKASFEVYPEIELASLEGQNFEKPVITISETDIDATIDNIRKQNQNFVAADRGAEQGDRVTVDFTGTIDGQPFKGNEGKNVPVTIGQGQMIEGFEAGLKGAKAGDELSLELNFPEEYHFKEVAGKPVQFAIIVNKIEEPVLPELNDEFFSMFGITEGGMDAFRNEVRKNMQIELDSAVASRIKNAVMDKILEINNISVPKALVENEARNIAKQMQSQYQVQGENADALNLSLFEEQATKRVSLGLILADIVKTNKLTTTPEQIKEKIAQLSVSYENPQEVMDHYMSQKEKMAEIESFVLEEKVVNWALEQGNVTEKEFTFAEFMNPETATKEA